MLFCIPHYNNVTFFWEHCCSYYIFDHFDLSRIGNSTILYEPPISNYEKILEPECLRISLMTSDIFLVLCFSSSLLSFPLFQHRFETKVESILVICFKQRLFFVRPVFFGTPFEYLIESTICETVGITKEKEKDLKS